MPLQPQENNRTLQNFPLNQFNANEILQNVQQVVRETVKLEILDSPNIDNTYKTDMMDSFVSLVILDYKDYLSSQFLFSLKQNLYMTDEKRLIPMLTLNKMVPMRTFLMNNHNINTITNTMKINSCINCKFKTRDKIKIKIKIKVKIKIKTKVKVKHQDKI